MQFTCVTIILILLKFVYKSAELLIQCIFFREHMQENEREGEDQTEQ